MDKIPKIIAGVLIYNNEGEILLARSHKWQDTWITPGGHLDWGETLNQCVQREVKEETNLDVQNIEFLCIQEGFYSNEHYKNSHMVFLTHIANSEGGDIILNDELQEYKWFKPDEALKEELIKNIREVIELFISRKEQIG